MFRPLLLALTLPLSANEPLPTANPEELGMSSQALAKIAPSVEGLIAKNKLAGGSVLVLRKGHIVYQEQFGFSDREAKASMAPDTLFRIYSMTKGITSAAALMLCEEGKLSLDDAIQLHLPELKDFQIWPEKAARRQPTVRDLLRHTTGCAAPWGPSKISKKYRQAKIPDRTRPLTQLPKNLSTVPLLDQPGAVWRYGVSSDILAAVVEKVSGQPFDVFLQSRLIGPLGMTDTSYQVPIEKVPRFSVTYQSKNGELHAKDRIPTSNFLKDRAFKGGGSGLVSTITDYARFLQMIANSGEFQGKRYLRKSTVDLMRTNQLPLTIPCISFGKDQRHGTGFGLGFSVRIAKDNRWDKHAALGEYGWGGFASTHYWISPQHDLIVITMEQTVPYNWNLEQTLKPIIYAAIKQ